MLLPMGLELDIIKTPINVMCRSSDTVCLTLVQFGI